jgi:hypothetical protein
MAENPDPRRDLALAAAHSALEAATELLRFAREGDELNGPFSNDVDVFEKLADAAQMAAEIDDGVETDPDYVEMRGRVVHAIAAHLAGWA